MSGKRASDDREDFDANVQEQVRKFIFKNNPYPVKPIGEHGENRVIPLKELSRFFRIGPNAANSLLLPDNDSDPPRNYVYTRVRLNEGV